MRRILAAAISAAGLAALCLGCANAAGSSGSGSLVVSLDSSSATSLGRATGGAKTVLPDFASLVDGVTVTLSASGQSSVSKTASGLGGSLSFVGLSATSWTISAYATSGGTVIGSGSATASVSSGSQLSITLPITFSGYSSGSGTMTLPISWPGSSGVDYLSYAIDGGSASAAQLSASGSYYTTTISASLSSGAHTLALSFKKGGSSGTSAGNFVEAVDIWNGLTSSSWIGSSTAVASVLRFSASDFLSSNDSLGGLVVQDGSSSGSALSIDFSSSSTSYDLYTLPSSGSIVIIPTASDEGQRISYSWNGGTAVPLSSGSVSAALTLDTSSYDNVLTITVLAPDGETARAYTLIWHSASVTVGVTTSANYVSLSFPASYVVAKGNAVNIETSNATLQAISSGWTWFLDGTEQSGSSQIFSLDTTSLDVGSHYVYARVSYQGVAYSGGTIVTVKQ